MTVPEPDAASDYAGSNESRSRQCATTGERILFEFNSRTHDFIGVHDAELVVYGREAVETMGPQLGGVLWSAGRRVAGA